VEENANKLHLSSHLICYSLKFFDIFGVKYSESFPRLIANKFFMSLFFYFFYFCDQLVAPKNRHSRRHCSVCQQSTWYSATRTKFW